VIGFERLENRFVEEEEKVFLISAKRKVCGLGSWYRCCCLKLIESVVPRCCHTVALGDVQCVSCSFHRRILVSSIDVIDNASLKTGYYYRNIMINLKI